jgi:hypothetical protein
MTFPPQLQCHLSAVWDAIPAAPIGKNFIEFALLESCGNNLHNNGKKRDPARYHKEKSESAKNKRDRLFLPKRSDHD